MILAVSQNQTEILFKEICEYRTVVIRDHFSISMLLFPYYQHLQCKLDVAMQWNLRSYDKFPSLPKNRIFFPKGVADFPAKNFALQGLFWVPLSCSPSRFQYLLVKDKMYPYFRLQWN